MAAKKSGKTKASAPPPDAADAADATTNRAPAAARPARKAAPAKPKTAAAEKPGRTAKASTSVKSETVAKPAKAAKAAKAPAARKPPKQRVAAAPAEEPGTPATAPVTATASPAIAEPTVAPGADMPTVVHLSWECFPYARSGGLAEAVHGLANTQARQGMRAVILLPLHSSVSAMNTPIEPVGERFDVQLGPRRFPARLWRDTSIPPGHAEVYFLEQDALYARRGLYGESGRDYRDNHLRVAFFSLAAVIALPRLAPHGDVLLHAHDWHAALAPVYLRTFFGAAQYYQRVATVLTAHNPGYQGHFGADIMPELGLPWELFNYAQLEWYGHTNLLKGGLVFSDMVVTVSPTHARELCTPDGGFGLHGNFRGLGDRLVGIINGIDQDVWDPTRDGLITERFSATEPAGKQACKAALQRTFGLPQRKSVPLFGFTGRFVKQKGLDLVIGARQLFNLDAQFVFLGSGDPGYGDALMRLARQHPDKLGVLLDFSDRLEHRVMAGSDILLMPSEYEPCGLTQMRAQRYGAPPVGRRVGGLADTIEDGVTGFLFDAFRPEALEHAAVRAIVAYRNPALWTAMVRTAMARDFSWRHPSARYLQVYRAALARVR